MKSRSAVSMFVFCGLVFQSGLWASEGELTEASKMIDLVKDKKFSAISEIVAQWESDWKMTKDDQYFSKMYDLCACLFNGATSKQEYDLFQGFAEEALSKREPIKEVKSAAFYLYSAKLSLLLLSEDAYLQKLDRAEFKKVRNQNVSVVSSFIKMIKVRRQGDYVPKPVTKNVEDPSGTLPAGGDPAQIKDPESRDKYEKAIAENSRNWKENDEQYVISKILSRDVPVLQDCIINLYGKEPIAWEELTAHLEVADFSAVDKERILESAKKLAGSSNEVPDNGK